MRARKKSGDLTTAIVPAGTSFPAVLREPFDLVIARYAATSFFDQLNSVWLIHMRCRMTASLRATRTWPFGGHGAWRASSPKPLAPTISVRGSVTRPPLRKDNCVAWRHHTSRCVPSSRSPPKRGVGSSIRHLRQAPIRTCTRGAALTASGHTHHSTRNTGRGRLKRIKDHLC